MTDTPTIVVPIDEYVSMSNELDMLRAENAELREYVGDGLLRRDFKSAQEMRAEIKRLHEEVLHLRLYAPGQRTEHVVKTIPRVGETNWRFYGLALAEADFDSFGKLVPNETES